VIEDGAWIGAGVIILPRVTIGRSAVVGAGAVATKDVPPCTVVVVCPLALSSSFLWRQVRSWNL
jgi:acetyltransferase-like isoleucine patch superfamily enzyme